MSNRITAPTITEGDGVHIDYTEEHPSYGLINIGRITVGGGVSLFGSSIKHGELIMLTISTAVKHRNLHMDWFHQRGELIEIWMSPTQFAEAITHLNMGSGTPVTIRHANGKENPMPMYENKTSLFSKEFKKDVKEVAAGLDEAVAGLERLLEGKTVSKSEVREALAKVMAARQEIDANMPFVVEQFHEQMEKTVTEAKGEVDAFVNRVVHQTGLKTLQEGGFQLLEQSTKERSS